MNHIKDIYIPRLEETFSLNPPIVSFEFFPPKTPELEEKLWQSIIILEKLNPSYVSVTYGAGGSTKNKTRETVLKLRDQTTLSPAAHLTCVGASKHEIDQIAQDYWNEGIKHIVALRGDLPEDNGKYIPHPEGYAYADDLVKGLKAIGDFKISVAAYPETHPDALSPEADIEHLKRKIDAGADQAITQYFFNTDLYFSFLDKVRAAGIEAPIIPGVVLINSYAQIVRFSKMCGATIPNWLTHLLESLDDDPSTFKTAATLIAAEQCRILVEQGVKQFHFYTLNRSESVVGVCHLLNVRPKPTQKSE